MSSRELDQFYTKRKVASECYKEVCKILDINNYKIIEPSAGEGSFSDLFHNNSLALDLDPQKEYILKQDFLDFNIQKKSENILTIGNPPFGKNSSLAIKFFNNAAIFSDYIAMIFPKTFKKDSVVNKLDSNFHLIEEFFLNKNSFIFKGKDYSVPCVFQIWEKRSYKRKKIIQKNATEYFVFSDKNNADFAIRRVGGLAGKVIEDFEKYKEPSHYYIKVSENKSNIIKVLNKCYRDLNERAKNAAGNPSLSKHELITCVEEYLNKSA